MAYKFQRGEAILSGALLQEGNIEIEEGFSFSMHEETIVDTSRNLTVVGISGSANLQAGGALTVAGASDLNGALDVAGASSLAATGVLTDIRGTLSVDEAAVFDSTIQLAGALDANSTSDFQGAMNLQAGITVAGASDLNGALDASGASSFAASGVLTDIRGTLSVDEAAVFDSTIQLAGALDANSTSDFQGAMNLQAGITVAGISKLDGAIDANSTSDFAGAMNLQAGITVAGASDLNGALDVAGASSFAASGVLTDIRGTLSVDEAAVFDSTLGVTGASTLAAASFSGAIDANSTSDFQGAMNLQAGITVAGASDLNGALDVAGASSLAAAGVLTDIRGTLQLSGVAAAVADVAADSLYFLDGDSLVKKESIVDFVSAMAGAGLSATSGVLKVTGNDVHLKADGETLQEGYNYFADISADAGVTLPASPTVGDVVHIKAGNITGDDVEITVTKAGSQLIDGDAAIYLESPYAAVSLVYVASDAWRIV